MSLKNYSTYFPNVNELSNLVYGFPMDPINNSSYFESVSNLFFRMDNLKEKYDDLKELLFTSKKQADNLAAVYKLRGKDALINRKKSLKAIFSTIAIHSNGKVLYFISLKLNTALQDYVSRYSEFLETLKYILSEAYNDHLGPKDSFNRFVTRKTTKSSQYYDFSYFIEFNDIMWNAQKHKFNLSLSPTIVTNGVRADPTLQVHHGRFASKNTDIFLEESIDQLISLMKFIQGSFVKKEAT